jgi:hypothetical protein
MLTTLHKNHSFSLPRPPGYPVVMRKSWSVTQVNSIRQAVVASLLGTGEAQLTHGPLIRGGHNNVVR